MAPVFPLNQPGSSCQNPCKCRKPRLTVRLRTLKAGLPSQKACPFQCPGNGQVVVGENGVYPHLHEFYCFFRIVSPKKIALDAAGVGFIDHLLVEVWFEKLHLVAFVLFRPLYNFPRFGASTSRQFQAIFRAVSRTGSSHKCVLRAVYL